MMRPASLFRSVILALVCLALFAGAASAQIAPPTSTLRIWSATDTAAMTGIIAGFKARYPSVAVEYTEFNTSELYAAVVSAGDDGPDLVISSAMDLQVRLVNRGYASPVRVPGPGYEWARWRDELFGFTSEPVVLLYDENAFKGRPLPSTRSELAAMIRDDPGFFDGRIGTYDILQSGVGYMFATQDAQRGYQSSRLVESLGRAHAKTFCCTSDMVAAVSRGELVLAYNVIGSYTRASVAKDPHLRILLLNDYTLVFSRTVFLSKHAKHPVAGSNFIAFLLSPEGQSIIEKRSSLFPLLPLGPESQAYFAGIFQGGTSLLPIRMRPGLLTWLDDMKKATFLREWASSISGPR